MSVRRRRRRDPETGASSEVWMIDVDFQHPDGRRQRVRKVSPVQSRRAAERYERDVRAALLDGTYGREEVTPKRVPSLAEFEKDFIETYAETNNKPSVVAGKRSVFKKHLIPAFGKQRLDEIGPKEIESFKAAKLKAALSPKTVNNLLSTLHRVLATAEEWEIIDRVPRMKWLKTGEPDFDFLDFVDAERLLLGAKSEKAWWTFILLALRTGLRLGELRALRWDDVDLVAGRLLVRHSAWKQIIGTPKSNRKRELPLSDEAVAALKAHRHLRGQFVFCREDGRMLTKEECKHPLRRAYTRAGLRAIGWHVLRHTFASHLAMKSVPMKAIQELMGHATMEMTMRYSHLSPDVRRDAVRLLDRQGHGTIAAPETKSTLSS